MSISFIFKLNYSFKTHMHTILSLDWMDAQQKSLPLGASSRICFFRCVYLQSHLALMPHQQRHFRVLVTVNDGKTELRVNGVVESLSAVRFCNWMQK